MFRIYVFLIICLINVCLNFGCLLALDLEFKPLNIPLVLGCSSSNNFLRSTLSTRLRESRKQNIQLISQLSVQLLAFHIHTNRKLLLSLLDHCSIHQAQKYRYSHLHSLNRMNSHHSGLSGIHHRLNHR